MITTLRIDVDEGAEGRLKLVLVFCVDYDYFVAVQILFKNRLLAPNPILLFVLFRNVVIENLGAVVCFRLEDSLISLSISHLKV